MRAAFCGIFLLSHISSALFPLLSLLPFCVEIERAERGQKEGKKIAVKKEGSRKTPEIYAPLDEIQHCLLEANSYTMLLESIYPSKA